ncbi:GNVR domain-containing protein, partial [Poseidonibacter sp.]|uniref:GNVR domain-containing protein n=1 Tax=Poseidonibacter sp. TaxID=2321188 RepID=UPI003C73195A
NLIKRLQMMYMNNMPNEQSSTVTDISLVKGTTNLVEITVQSINNKLAISKLDEIIKNVKQVHDSKIEDYKSLINTNINNLKQQRAELEDEKNRFEGSQALKYELTTTLNQLSLSISSYNITPTKMLGKIMTNDYPVKPKKKLIVVVALVTGFILSIFIVFFMQFIAGFKEEKSNS